MAAPRALSRRRFLELSAAAVATGALPQDAATAVAGPELPGSIRAAGRRLRDGTLTCEALTRACLERVAALEPRLNAFVTITRGDALRTARARDRELRAGRDRGPLHGIPIVHKDLFDTAGVRTTVGSRPFADRVPRRDAAVVARLRRAGAVTLGKAGMNELAAGVTGTNEAFGDTHNPWDPARSPGGSSSGTAAAVAAGLCLGGTGTDTGGSIRVPAGWTGIAGVRPTPGLVPLTGAYPRAPSLDTAGPLGRTVADVALLLAAMAGAQARRFAGGLDRGIRGVRIGVVNRFTFRDLDLSVAGATLDALGTLRGLGARIRTVRIPLLEGSDLPYDAFGTILAAEFHRVLRDEDPGRFGAIVRADLERGANVSAAEYRDAQRGRRQTAAQVRGAFDRVDALVTPMLPAVAPLLTADDRAFTRARQFTVPFSDAGLPAASIPCGFGPAGLPIGLQIVGGRGDDALVLRIARAFEAATRFGERRPPVVRRR